MNIQKKYVAIMCIAISSYSCYSNAQNLTINDIFIHAWKQQTEYKSFDANKKILKSKYDISQQVFSDSPDIEINHKSSSNNKSIELAVTMPLWLSQQKSSTQNAIKSEQDLLNASFKVAQLNLYGDIRARYWLNASAKSDLDLAKQQLDDIKKLFLDVERRFKAGDMSKVDYNQALLQVLESENNYQQAQAKFLQSNKSLELWSKNSQNISEYSSEKLPDNLLDDKNWQSNLDIYISKHPIYEELNQKLLLAKANYQLNVIKSAKNPELNLSVEKQITGDSKATTLMLGVKVPFDLFNSSNKRAVLAKNSSDVEIINLSTVMDIERNKLRLSASNAKLELETSFKQLALYEQQATLSKNNLDSFTKSFNLGETDFPTLLRISQQNLLIQQDLNKSKISVNIAISNIKQALGIYYENN
jgi:outer membrane protein TolC